MLWAVSDSFILKDRSQQWLFYFIVLLREIFTSFTFGSVSSALLLVHEVMGYARSIHTHTCTHNHSIMIQYHGQYPDLDIVHEARKLSKVDPGYYLGRVPSPMVGAGDPLI